MLDDKIEKKWLIQLNSWHWVFERHGDENFYKPTGFWNKSTDLALDAKIACNFALAALNQNGKCAKISQMQSGS